MNIDIFRGIFNLFLTEYEKYYINNVRKGKPVERQGRKTKGLRPLCGYDSRLPNFSQTFLRLVAAVQATERQLLFLIYYIKT
jgi:hypothetical protein